MYIEVQSNRKGMVQPALKRALDDIRNFGIEIVDSKIEDVIKEENAYSGVLELEIRADLKNYLKVAMIYSPTAIDILEGAPVLEKRELLETLGDVSSIMSKLMKEMELTFKLRPEQVDRITIDEEKEYLPVTLICEVQGDEEKIKEQAELVFADCRAFIEKMKIRREKGSAMLGIVGLFPDMESLFETTAKLTPVAFATDRDEIALTMRDAQVVGMSLSSITSDIATTKLSMDF